MSSPAVSEVEIASTSHAFLDVRDLHTTFPTEDGLVHSVDGVSFSLEAGRTLAIVGESGSGKSVTMSTVMGLYRGSRAQITGEVWLDGTELLNASEEEVRLRRGSMMSMIFQDPLSALHPYYSVGNQISEAYLAHHKGTSKKTAREHTIGMLERVGIPNARGRVDAYPHEFSGGMRQRVMIAMALVNSPKLLIADEPTTALDVTVQAQILELMKDLQREFDSAIVMITHDLGVVAEIADDVLVMYGGKPVETGASRKVFYESAHPYTWGLLKSMPRIDRGRATRLDPIPGNPPSLINLPSGCAFNPRCAFPEVVGGDKCKTHIPELYRVEVGHHARCFLTNEQRIELMEVPLDAVDGPAADVEAPVDPSATTDPDATSDPAVTAEPGGAHAATASADPAPAATPAEEPDAPAATPVDPTRGPHA